MAHSTPSLLALILSLLLALVVVLQVQAVPVPLDSSAALSSRQADTPTVAAVPFERRGSAGSKLVSKLKPSSSDDAEEREPLLANKGAVNDDVVAPPAPQVPAAQSRPTSRPTGAPTAVQTAVANALRPFQAGFR